MNILIPDSWLRAHLKTKATPKELKEYLSLCGPSIERINTVGKETVYDIEITTNRVDSMSIIGIAREAAVILPRFGIAATLLGDPYNEKSKIQNPNVKTTQKFTLKITTDPKLNPRFTAIVLDNITVDASPRWLSERLELTGIRSINTVVDVTNYIMRLYGQPVHAFDFDEIKKGTMIVRAAKKGEKVTTLDDKTHTLPGGDIIMEDGEGRIIDLCGIMGAKNSSVKSTTKRIVLFMQTYDPIQIRRTSMALAHRSEASGMFEKGIDAELVMPAMQQGIELMAKVAGATPASKLYDVYPKPFKNYEVTCTKKLASAYIGTTQSDKDIKNILSPLGMSCKLTKNDITVSVPSWRPDIERDVDIIEELARIYGYHNMANRLPDTEPPVVQLDPQLALEADIKIRLRDWGFTELYTYSMISEEQMQIFDLDPKTTYKVSNELSSEWVYMRPSLLPSVLAATCENLRIRADLALFELSMTYGWRGGDLPKESSTLVIVRTGETFHEVKGVVEAVCTLYGINPTYHAKKAKHFHPARTAAIDGLGIVGEIDPALLTKLGIKQKITVAQIDIEALLKMRKTGSTYTPIPKFPPAIEDIAFVVGEQFQVGPLLSLIKACDPLVKSAELFDTHQNTRTVRVTYLSTEKSLNADDIRPVREKILTTAENTLGASLKTA